MTEKTDIRHHREIVDTVRMQYAKTEVTPTRRPQTPRQKLRYLEAVAMRRDLTPFEIGSLRMVKAELVWWNGEPGKPTRYWKKRAERRQSGETTWGAESPTK